MVATATSMSNYFAHILRVESIENVEEVLSVRRMTLGILIREIHHEDGIILEIGKKFLDRELLILWNVDHFDFRKFEELLLISKNCSEKVFVHHDFWRKIELHCRHDNKDFVREIVQDMTMLRCVLRRYFDIVKR